MPDEPEDQKRKYLKYYKNELAFKITRLIWPFYELAWHINKIKNRRLFLIGQSHIDAAWVWRKEYTIDKVKKTFTNALNHFQIFPNFKFSASSPQYYEWMRIYYPEIFSRIIKAVNNSRWELVGGSWIEPDCNIPDGESLCRQRLKGMLFYRKYFKKTPQVEWFLDSFGYNVGLPQIISKSKGKYFWTSKIKWNKQIPFPFNYFRWQSPDGSTILTNNCEGGWGPAMSFRTHPEFYKPLKRGKSLIANYSTPDDLIEENLDDDGEYVPFIGIFYGKGDGGHGPWVREIVEAECVASLKHYEISDAHTFFGNLEQLQNRLPVWNDELAIDIHRGTFTTHSYMKWLNRRCEILLNSAEKLLTFIFTAGSANLKENIFPIEDYKDFKIIFGKLWQILLFNQFHDILPGTSIPGVYLETFSELEGILYILYTLIKRGLGTNGPIEFTMESNNLKNVKGVSLKEAMHSPRNTPNNASNSGSNSAAAPTQTLILYNPLSWTRNEFLEIPVKGASFKQLSEKIAKIYGSNPLDYENIKRNLVALKIDEDPLISIHKFIPSDNIDMENPIRLSYPDYAGIKGNLIDLGPIEGNHFGKSLLGRYNAYSGEVLDNESILLVPSVKVKGLSIQSLNPMKLRHHKSAVEITEDNSGIIVKNKFLKIEISKTSGNITSLSGPENLIFLKEGEQSCRIAYYVDKAKKEPAWNIDPEYLEKEFSRFIKVEGVSIVEKGPLRCVIRVTERLTNLDEVPFPELKERAEGAEITIENKIEKFYVMRADVPYLELGIKIRWSVPNTMLKLEVFPNKIFGQDPILMVDSSYSIRFDDLYPKTPRDKVRTEKPCHKFIAITSRRKGRIIGERDNERPILGILTHDKYGFGNTNGSLQLTLLRTPRYPDPTPVERFNWNIPDLDKRLAEKFKWSDLGETFTRYAIFPHVGTVADVYRAAKEFNSPLFHSISDSAELRDSSENEINIAGISCEEHVEISVIKPAELEKDKTIILRLYEFGGYPERNFKIRLSARMSVRKAAYTDILEDANIEDSNANQIEKECRVEDANTLIIDKIGPFEIKTIKIYLTG